jgi:hypothetical protein
MYFSLFVQTKEFRAHDRSHPRSKEIYEESARLTEELIAHGHRFDASWITKTIENDDTIQSVLCGHSERIALAFNFIQRPVPTTIQLVKNLRICGDCRSY